MCTANSFPPGFRIVLIDDGGRTRRDDLMVRSGGFCAYPASFAVWQYFEEALKDEVRDADALDYARAELRDHRGEPVSPHLTLREVRDLPGEGGKHAKAWEEGEDYIFELKLEIEDALNIFEDDFRLLANPNSDLLLKALVRYMISCFEIEAVDHVLDLYGDELDVARARAGMVSP